MSVPRNMLWMFLWERCAKAMLRPVARQYGPATGEARNPVSCQRFAQRTGIGQRLPDTEGLADMWAADAGSSGGVCLKILAEFAGEAFSFLRCEIWHLDGSRADEAPAGRVYHGPVKKERLLVRAEKFGLVIGVPTILGLKPGKVPLGGLLGVPEYLMSASSPAEPRFCSKMKRSPLSSNA